MYLKVAVVPEAWYNRRMKLRQYNVTGMSCAACSARVEKAVKGVKGVDEVAVNLLTNSMSVSGSADDDDIIKAVTAAGYGCSIQDDRSYQSDTGTLYMVRRLVISAVISAVLMYFTMSGRYRAVQSVKYIQMALALAVMAVNFRYFVSGVRGIINKAPNMDTLVSMGSLASFIYGYYDSAAMILAFINIGKTLEAYSKGRTADAVRSLMKLVPQVDIRAGDEFEVRPGEIIPADGAVIAGVSAVDESALTGESIPADKEKGDTVHAGTINKSGYLKCTAEKVGSDTTLGQIIKLVSETASTKAPIAKIADKAAGVFVPIVIGSALLTFIIWLIAGAGTGFALSRAVSVLVISCPCALGLATPVAIMVGSGRGAGSGILFKTAVSLEQAGEATVCALDKTGTITKGAPAVTDVIPAVQGSCGMCPDCTGAGTCENYAAGSREELLSIAYALEVKSGHPLAKAVVEYAGSGPIVEDFKSLTGSGVEGILDGTVVYGGNRKFIAAHAALDARTETICDALSEQGKTPLLFAREGRLVGIIAVADTVRENSAKAITQLKRLGMKVVMITGDNERTARSIGKQTGVDEVAAGVFPDQKAAVIERLRETDRVLMAGDGINDAPALTAADVGAAIGAGTDVAIDAADVVLMKSSLMDVAAAVRLSRRVIRTIRQNLFWAFFYNAIGIPLAAGVWYPLTGWELKPMFCAAAMSISSIFVVGNALRLNLMDMYDASGDRPLSERKRKKLAKEIKKRRESAAIRRDTEVKSGADEKNTSDFRDSCESSDGSGAVCAKEEEKMYRTIIEVKGMMCPMCEKHTCEAIEKAFTVVSVKASHEDDQTVIISTEKPDADKLASVIREAGYQPGAVTVEEE